MKTIILAAGYATRLYPYTKNFPKPLLEVGGMTILDRLIDDVASFCDMEFIIVSNDKFYNHFASWAEKSKHKITIINDKTQTNETRLGAVRDVALAVELLHIDDDLLVLAGDNILSFSLKSFVEYARQKNAPAILRYDEQDVERLKKSGVVEIDSDDRVLCMTEKSPEPKSNHCCPPFYYYDKKSLPLIFSALDDNINTDAPGSLFAYVSQKTPSFAMQMPGKRYDIGDIVSLEETRKIFSTNTNNS